MFDILGHVYLLILLNGVTLCFVAMTVFGSCSFKTKPLIAVSFFLGNFCYCFSYDNLLYFSVHVGAKISKVELILKKLEF